MLSSRPLILLVRHGRTKLNSDGKIRGWENPPLDRLGELDAQVAGNKLRDYGVQMIYHSDFIRDTQTSHIIAAMLGNIPVEPDYRLRTADLGEWNGQNEKALNPLMYRWYTEPWMKAPSGESYNEFVRRWFEVYEEKLEIARSIETFRPTLLAVHGRNFSSLHSRYAGLPPEKAEMALPGGLALVSEGADGRDSFEFLTETEPVLEDD